MSLKLMPLGMQRRMDNTSRYDTGTQVLSWRVQWSVHVGGSSAALQLTSAAVPETHSILDAVTEALGEASGSAGEAPLEQLAAAKAALSEDPPIAAFYLEHPYRVKGERQWLPVQGGTALAAAVKGATIVEFPHIAVDCTGSGCYPLYTPPPPPPPAPAPGPGQSHAATSGAQAATVSAGTAGAPFPGAGVAPVYSTGHGAGSTHSLASFTQAARSVAAAGAVSGPHRAGGAAEVLIRRDAAGGSPARAPCARRASSSRSGCFRGREAVERRAMPPAPLQDVGAAWLMPSPMGQERMVSARFPVHIECPPPDFRVQAGCVSLSPKIGVGRSILLSPPHSQVRVGFAGPA